MTSTRMSVFFNKFPSSISSQTQQSNPTSSPISQYRTKFVSSPNVTIERDEDFDMESSHPSSGPSASAINSEDNNTRLQSTQEPINYYIRTMPNVEDKYSILISLALTSQRHLLSQTTNNQKQSKVKVKYENFILDQSCMYRISFWNQNFEERLSNDIYYPQHQAQMQRHDQKEKGHDNFDSEGQQQYFNKDEILKNSEQKCSTSFSSNVPRSASASLKVDYVLELPKHLFDISESDNGRAPLIHMVVEVVHRVTNKITAKGIRSLLLLPPLGLSSLAIHQKMHKPKGLPFILWEDHYASETKGDTNGRFNANVHETLNSDKAMKLSKYTSFRTIDSMRDRIALISYYTFEGLKPDYIFQGIADLPVLSSPVSSPRIKKETQQTPTVKKTIDSKLQQKEEDIPLYNLNRSDRLNILNKQVGALYSECMSVGSWPMELSSRADLLFSGFGLSMSLSFLSENTSASSFFDQKNKYPSMQFNTDKGSSSMIRAKTPPFSFHHGDAGIKPFLTPAVSSYELDYFNIKSQMYRRKVKQMYDQTSTPFSLPPTSISPPLPRITAYLCPSKVELAIKNMIESAANDLGNLSVSSFNTGTLSLFAFPSVDVRSYNWKRHANSPILHLGDFDYKGGFAEGSYVPSSLGSQNSRSKQQQDKNNLSKEDSEINIDIDESKGAASLSIDLPYEVIDSSGGGIVLVLVEHREVEAANEEYIDALASLCDMKEEEYSEIMKEQDQQRQNDAYNTLHQQTETTMLQMEEYIRGQLLRKVLAVGSIRLYPEMHLEDEIFSATLSPLGPDGAGNIESQHLLGMHRKSNSSWKFLSDGEYTVTMHGIASLARNERESPRSSGKNGKEKGSRHRSSLKRHSQKGGMDGMDINYAKWDAVLNISLVSNEISLVGDVALRDFCSDTFSDEAILEALFEPYQPQNQVLEATLTGSEPKKKNKDPLEKEGDNEIDENSSNGSLYDSEEESLGSEYSSEIESTEKEKISTPLSAMILPELENSGSLIRQVLGPLIYRITRLLNLPSLSTMAKDGKSLLYGLLCDVLFQVILEGELATEEARLILSHTMSQHELLDLIKNLRFDENEEENHSADVSEGYRISDDYSKPFGFASKENDPQNQDRKGSKLKVGDRKVWHYTQGGIAACIIIRAFLVSTAVQRAVKWQVQQQSHYGTKTHRDEYSLAKISVEVSDICSDLAIALSGLVDDFSFHEENLLSFSRGVRQQHLKLIKHEKTSNLNENETYEKLEVEARRLKLEAGGFFLALQLMHPISVSVLPPVELAEAHTSILASIQKFCNLNQTIPLNNYIFNRSICFLLHLLVSYTMSPSKSSLSSSKKDTSASLVSSVIPIFSLLKKKDIDEKNPGGSHTVESYQIDNDYSPPAEISIEFIAFIFPSVIEIISSVIHQPISRLTLATGIEGRIAYSLSYLVLLLIEIFTHWISISGQENKKRPNFLGGEIISIPPPTHAPPDKSDQQNEKKLTRETNDTIDANSPTHFEENKSKTFSKNFNNSSFQQEWNYTIISLLNFVYHLSIDSVARKHLSNPTRRLIQSTLKSLLLADAKAKLTNDKMDDNRGKNVTNELDSLLMYDILRVLGRLWDNDHYIHQPHHSLHLPSNSSSNEMKSIYKARKDNKFSHSILIKEDIMLLNNIVILLWSHYANPDISTLELTENESGSSLEDNTSSEELQIEDKTDKTTFNTRKIAGKHFSIENIPFNPSTSPASLLGLLLDFLPHAFSSDVSNVIVILNTLRVHLRYIILHINTQHHYIEKKISAKKKVLIQREFAAEREREIKLQRDQNKKHHINSKKNTSQSTLEEKRFSRRRSREDIKNGEMDTQIEVDDPRFNKGRSKETIQSENNGEQVNDDRDDQEKMDPEDDVKSEDFEFREDIFQFFLQVPSEILVRCLNFVLSSLHLVNTSAKSVPLQTSSRNHHLNGNKSSTSVAFEMTLIESVYHCLADVIFLSILQSHSTKLVNDIIEKKDDFSKKTFNSPVSKKHQLIPSQSTLTSITSSLKMWYFVGLLKQLKDSPNIIAGSQLESQADELIKTLAESYEFPSFLCLAGNTNKSNSSISLFVIHHLFNQLAEDPFSLYCSKFVVPRNNQFLPSNTAALMDGAIPSTFLPHKNITIYPYIQKTLKEFSKSFFNSKGALQKAFSLLYTGSLDGEIVRKKHGFDKILYLTFLREFLIWILHDGTPLDSVIHGISSLMTKTLSNEKNGQEPKGKAKSQSGKQSPKQNNLQLKLPHASIRSLAQISVVDQIYSILFTVGQRNQYDVYDTLLENDHSNNLRVKTILRNGKANYDLASASYLLNTMSNDSPESKEWKNMGQFHIVNEVDNELLEDNHLDFLLQRVKELEYLIERCICMVRTTGMANIAFSLLKYLEEDWEVYKESFKSIISDARSQSENSQQKQIYNQLNVATLIIENAKKILEKEKDSKEWSMNLPYDNYFALLIKDHPYINHKSNSRIFFNVDDLHNVFEVGSLHPDQSKTSDQEAWESSDSCCYQAQYHSRQSQEREDHADAFGKIESLEENFEPVWLIFKLASSGSVETSLSLGSTSPSRFWDFILKLREQVPETLLQTPQESLATSLNSNCYGTLLKHPVIQIFPIFPLANPSSVNDLLALASEFNEDDDDSVIMDQETKLDRQNNDTNYNNNSSSNSKKMKEGGDDESKVLRPLQTWIESQQTNASKLGGNFDFEENQTIGSPLHFYTFVRLDSHNPSGQPKLITPLQLQSWSHPAVKGTMGILTLTINSVGKALFSSVQRSTPQLSSDIFSSALKVAEFNSHIVNQNNHNETNIDISDFGKSNLESSTESAFDYYKNFKAIKGLYETVGSTLEWPCPAAMVLDWDVEPIDSAIAINVILISQRLLLSRAKESMLQANLGNLNTGKSLSVSISDSSNPSQGIPQEDDLNSILYAIPTITQYRNTLEAMIETIISPLTILSGNLNSVNQLVIDDREKRDTIFQKKRKEVKRQYIRLKSTEESAGRKAPPPPDVDALEAKLKKEPIKMRALKQEASNLLSAIKENISLLRTDAKDVKEQQILLWLESMLQGRHSVAL